MKTVLVYHATNPTFGLSPKHFPQDYVLVAELQFDASQPEGELLERAFRYTNTVDEHWTKNRRIKRLPAGHNLRSTSVGDVVKIDDQAWLCENVGWSKIVPNTEFVYEGE